MLVAVVVDTRTRAVLFHPVAMVVVVTVQQALFQQQLEVLTQAVVEVAVVAQAQQVGQE
jgi:hypothetical protein